MLLRALPVAAALVLVLAGCAGGAQPARSASPTPAATTPTPTPLVTPAEERGEIARAVLADGVVLDGAGALPAQGQVAVEVACSGDDGSMLRWRLETGGGGPLGLTGTADCTAPPSTSWLGITADPRPGRVRIVLEPEEGVVAGWAIVRTGTP